MDLDMARVRPVVRAALEEDLDAAGDVTTDAVIDGERRSAAHVVARAALVLSGLDVAREVFLTLDRSVEFRALRRDGEELEPGERAASVSGRTAAILRGERTALNFLTRMSGIATMAQTAVREIAGTRARILDTRKTAPGLRLLDKYAVACGGASNHRMGLFDAPMIKDTHLDSGCTIAEAVRRLRERGHAAATITVEVRTPQELREAIAAGAGRALLDNMDLASLREAVAVSAGRIVLEASGGLRPGGLREVAATGVDFLSLGWLTHSAPAADLALEMEALG